MAENQRGLYERLAPVLLVAVVILAFAVGTLWQKVSGLSKSSTSTANTGNTNTAPAPVADDIFSEEALVSYAGENDLDVNAFETCLSEGRYSQEVKDDLSQGTQLGVTGTPAFFMNGIQINGAMPYSVFEVLLDFELAGGDWANPPEDLAYLVDGNPQNGEIVTERATVELGNAPIKGEANAPITLIEFSDFECPYCATFWQNTLPQITEKYIDSGQVRMAYKDFPLSQIHPSAQTAAEAAECAHEQGSFWEYHDKVFAAMASRQ